MKYAKYLPELNRRETWAELVTRNMHMHIKKYPQLEAEIRENYKLVYEKKVLPSMRSMQFAGKPIEISPNRIYNCGYAPVDDWRVFSEIMLLLLGGCFEENTEIRTRAGIKKIKDVTIDDEVLTYDDKEDVYYWVKPKFAGMTPTASKPKIELTLENGKVIKCTADHKFYTNNRGWVEAKDLTEYDDIKVIEEEKMRK